MGRIVEAAATSHILMAPVGVEERAKRIVAGMNEIGRRLRAAQPNAIIVISSDHMFNINLALQPPFCVGVSDGYVPFGDMEIPREKRPGSRALGEALVRRAAARGFDLAKAEELRPDHGVALPLLAVDPERRIPIVPLLVNINMDPPPAPARCHSLGRVLRLTVEEDRPAGERVAVLATGGLSHWLNVPRHGEVNEAFDRSVMDILTAGRGGELARLSAAEIVARGGNGGLEVMNWLMAGAAAGEKGGEVVYYEKMPEWFTGMGGITLDVDGGIKDAMNA
jgi:2'-aminobiphenyl-2,3-diol 1,2-dioxygenase large subunit